MRRLSFTVAVILVALVSGCAQDARPDLSPAQSPAASSSDAVSTPSPPPTESPDPTAEATDGAADVPSTILVRADGLEILNGEGDLLTKVHYADPVEGVVADLTRAIGRAPVLGRFQGGIESDPGTLYNWDGLQVHDSDFQGPPPRHPEWSVSVSTASAGALAVSTGERLSVGLTQAEVEAKVPGTLTAGLVGNARVMDGVYEETEIGRDEQGNTLTHSIFLRLSGSPLVVSGFGAPGLNFGN